MLTSVLLNTAAHKAVVTKKISQRRVAKNKQVIRQKHWAIKMLANQHTATDEGQTEKLGDKGEADLKNKE